MSEENEPLSAEDIADRLMEENLQLRRKIDWFKDALRRKGASLEYAERAFDIQDVRPIGRWMRELANGYDERDERE